ncbi:MAG: hypothetical protein K9N11_00990 [Lentisphaeria bacterium]|nr:hypothetical protein [Candidatus Neomarinimicrobiota bacterium]MCF7841403.1 hypothetical protein [Lentisphaeria bacterium]
MTQPVMGVDKVGLSEEGQSLAEWFIDHRQVCLSSSLLSLSNQVKKFFRFFTAPFIRQPEARVEKAMNDPVGEIEQRKD